MKLFILAVLPILACTVQGFLIEPEDEIINSYKSTRALLTPEQQEFLMELLAADDALIAEATSRGIVDDILQAIAGAGNSNIRVNIIGGSTQQQQQQPTNNAPAPAAQPPYTLINPSFTVVSNARPNPVPAAAPAPGANSTETSTSAPVPAADIGSPASSSSSSATPSTPGSAASAPQSASAPIGNRQLPSISSLFNNGTNYQMTSSSATSNTTTTTIGGSNNHLFSTISQVIMNSNRRNVTGIVDESLRIATPAPIREFVTGILQVVYCNGIRRLLGRC